MHGEDENFSKESMLRWRRVRGMYHRFQLCSRRLTQHHARVVEDTCTDILRLGREVRPVLS